MRTVPLIDGQYGWRAGIKQHVVKDKAGKAGRAWLVRTLLAMLSVCALYSKSSGKVFTMLNRGLTRYLCFAKVSLLQCDDQKGEDQEWTQRSQLKGYSVIHMMVAWTRRQNDGRKVDRWGRV